MDYGYLHESSEEDTERVIAAMPIWCAKDTRRWIYATVLPTKGVEHPFNVREVTRQILAGGFTKVELRSDGE
eukprot:623265-Amphidinium_carterae.1